jgi:predicted PurR-regulated permease PerM
MNIRSEKIKCDGLLAVCLVVAILYFAREVLIPLALAILFAFLLEPLAARLETFHLGRFGAALTASLVPIILFGFLSYFVFGQVEELAAQWPKYEKNIHRKFRALEAKDLGVFAHAEKSVEEFKKDFTPTNNPASTNAMVSAAAAPRAEPQPVPVEVRYPETSSLQMVRNLIGPSVNIALTFFLVIVFCVFMLAGRADFRTRLLRIVGLRNIRLTMQMLEETGQRVGRYLFMQLIVNAIYGVPIGLGLWAIGIPNPVLWGVVATVLRYIPYVGPWIAATMPLALGFAIGSGLGKPFLVLALFAVLEITTANFVEPYLYGNTAGITPLAVLIAAVFWTWLWGPIGLLLSMPLTVCLVSLARYIPQLELLDHLFGKSETQKPELQT